MLGGRITMYDLWTSILFDTKYSAIIGTCYCSGTLLVGGKLRYLVEKLGKVYNIGTVIVFTVKNVKYENVSAPQ